MSRHQPPVPIVYGKTMVVHSTWIETEEQGDYRTGCGRFFSTDMWSEAACCWAPGQPVTCLLCIGAESHGK